MRSDRLPGEDARALGERISTIYSRLPGTAAVSVVNASLIIIVVQRQNANAIATLWLAAVILLSILRLAVWWRYRQDDRKLDHVRRWETVAVLCSLCAGALWGLGPLITGGGNGINQWLWAFAIGGMCAGAASLHAAHLRTALAFIVPACLPLAVALLMLGTFEGTAAGIMTIAFVGVTGFTALLFSKEFGKMLALRAALERRAAELHDANRRLSREIDDHRETSEALHQSQKMEALGSLTGGFAHDFNNLLTVILGNLDIVVHKVAGRDRTLLESAMAAAESGASLTARLLAFARKQTQAPRMVDITRLVADFEALLRRAVSGAIGVEFTNLAKRAVSPVDPAHLQAALLNLVVNARDAVAKGGHIRITIATATLGADDLVGMGALPGDFVSISVADDGEGMAADVRDRVFEPFFTTRASSGGSGLGLSQVYGFARQSGGFARVESEPGVGTVVTLFLPASDEAPEPVEVDPLARKSREQRSLSVLVVDDNPGVIGVLSAALANRGWEVTTAGDAASALAIIENAPAFDIVVSDIDMPGSFDGLELERRIRRTWPELPVLLISGAPVALDRIDAGSAFLIKPFRSKVFLAKIEELVATTA